MKNKLSSLEKKSKYWLMRHWGMSLREPLSDAEVCQRICILTGKAAPRRKERKQFMADYWREVAQEISPAPQGPAQTKSRELRRSFYQSDAWRALRYEALRLHGARCQCCGATARDGKVIHVDHIKPRSRYPHLELVLANLQVLCDDCNLGKAARDETDWRPAGEEESLRELEQ